MSQRACKACAAIFAALGLHGCVAAAIPALAGAAMVRNETSGSDATVTVADPPAVGEVALSPAVASEKRELVELSRLPSTGNVIFGEAPPPSNLGTGTETPLHDGYRALFDYVGEQAEPTVTAGTLPSAILSNPSALDGKRADCLAAIPTVLIDLDAHEEPAVGTPNTPVSPALGEGLQTLRELGVEIAWISERSAAEAGDIRLALRNSGIDPEGEDRLILTRYPGDRKQTRRTDLAEVSCIIAIAGDNREDFDELYEYLVRPDAALGLELLIGKGWFLVPPVLGEGG